MNNHAISVVHSIEQRVRLCAPLLVGNRRACEFVAERLADLPGYDVVIVRPLTGSVVVETRDEQLDPSKVSEDLDRAVAEARNESGEPLVMESPDRYPGPTRVARAVAHAFAEINADVRESMHGRADLGTVLPVFFAMGGIVEVVITKKLPAPAWFNLLWWSLRSFMTFNDSAVAEEKRKASEQEAVAAAT